MVNKNTVAEDVAILKSDMIEMKPLIREIHEKLFDGEKKIALNCQELIDLKKTIYGNGQPGLVQKVSGIDKKMAFYSGGIAIVVFAIQVIIKYI